MSFDGIIFTRVIGLLKGSIIGTRINKIYQLSDTEFVFNLYSKDIKTNLIISTNNNASFISLNENIKDEKMEVSHFLSQIYHHINNGKIIDIEQLNDDRIAKFSILKISELGIEKSYSLYVELTGKVTNLILAKDDDVIIDCLHKFGVTSNRTVLPGSTYRLPTSNKINSILKDTYNPNLSIKEQFGGMSINLIEEIEKRLATESIENIKNELTTSDSLYCYKSDYHIIKLSKFDENYVKFDIFDGINHFYQNRIVDDKPSENKELIKLVNKEIKKFTNKKAKLEKELKESSDNEKYMQYGDDIFAAPINLNDIKESIRLTSIIDNHEYELKLNSKISIKDNALAFYKKYKKLKNAGSFINEQIAICNTQVEYLNGVLFQLNNANLDDINLIKQELIDEKILKVQNTKNKKQLKIKIPSFEVDGIKISYGKNNIQNELLTLKTAKYNEFFFHVEKYSGSHVVVHATELNEKLIRFAANLAAYHSQARLSSSVPVNYCLIKDVKKSPENKPGKVIIKNYKTIYIDPKENF